MKVLIRKCNWYFHLYPRFYFGEFDFGRGCGFLIDWVGLTVEIRRA